MAGRRPGGARRPWWRLLRGVVARLVRWWWGYPSPVELVGRAVLLAGLTLVVFDVSRRPGYVAWILGLAVMYVGERRRHATDAGGRHLPDRDEDR